MSVLSGTLNIRNTLIQRQSNIDRNSQTSLKI